MSVSEVALDVGRTLAVSPDRIRVGRGRRGKMVRRALVAADLVGLLSAFAVAMVLAPTEPGAVDPGLEWVLFAGSLPLWLALFGIHGLYDRDEERADHSTVDEFFGVVQVTAIGTWVFTLLAIVTGLLSPDLDRLALFWVLSTLLLTCTRALARGICRRHPNYVQRVLVVGRGDVGQLLARKINQHPEYGMNLLGFVDGEPKAKRSDVDEVVTLGQLDELDALVRENDVDRIIVAFSNEPDESTMEVVRALRDESVIVDVVPRLFDLVGPRAEMHVIEGLPLISLRAARLSRLSLALKRAGDLVAGSILLLLTVPLFAYAAVRIKRESPGPVFFRQERLGQGMRPFELLKFRTMVVDTDEAPHRDYVRTIMDTTEAPVENNLYKLSRDDAVTGTGAWLRRTSLDELPQLINVLRGEMSLVGPRPCLSYECELFEPHHFDRFLVPAGMTGLWQVTARAKSTFKEALDLDTAYARNWSVGLDLKLMLRTPFVLLRAKGTA
jgi:exopolysaccharide biosynthesis polyprenyl glycosylphosphotransferase